jgi:hypothetical protein
MKPVNLDSKPCSPLSSNCVIWQGPDIPCINLCKGDTISDVVAALATELCSILDTLNIDNYDLTCFGIDNCGPDDFQALINFLIAKICELENISPEVAQDSNGCPTDCLVTVAECFQTNGQTTMNLVDYVLSIGNTICNIINDLAAIDVKVENLIERVTILENEPDPTFTLPSFDSCLLGSVQPIDTILQNLETEYCSLIDATGTPGQLALVKDRQCVADSDPSRANPSNAMSVEYSGTWITPVNTLADSLNNLWITLCDLRDQVIDIVTVAVTDTDTVDLTITAGPNYSISADISDSGWVDLEGFSFMTNPPQCRRIGNVIHFKGYAVVPLRNDVSGNVITFTNNFDYATATFSTYRTPFQGAGGVDLDPAGSITFNTSNSVIPLSILSGNLDDTYRIPFQSSIRPIQLATNVSTCLSSPLNIIITSDKKLILTTIKDSEQIFTNYTKSHGLRYITSMVTSGERVPDFLASNIFSDSAASPWPVALPQDGSYTWPVTVNGANEEHLGGFNIILDGLIAYV